jgi:hypothetical protein
MSHETTDYRQKPMILLAWGLGPDFYAGRNLDTCLGIRAKYLVLGLGIVSAVVLAVF